MKLTEFRRSPWAVPALLAVGSLFALVVSLAADGVWDVLSWLLLSLPLVVVTSALICSKKSPRKLEKRI